MTGRLYLKYCIAFLQLPFGNGIDREFLKVEVLLGEQLLCQFT